VPIGPRFLRITDIQNGSVNWSSVPFCEANGRKLDSARLKQGDIVFARTGATTGKSFLIRQCPEATVFASYLIRVRPSREVDPSFLAHFFDSPDYWNQINLKAAGAAQPGVNSSKLKELRVPFPPLAEQKRIAAILDQADALRRMRHRAIERLNDIGQAIFYDMFKNEAWPEIALASLGTVITGSTPPSGNEEYFSGTIPFVTPGDLESDEPVKRVVSELGAKKSRVVEAGATFVCCIGATIGKMDTARERSAFNQQINAIQWGDQIVPEYGRYAMNDLRASIIHKGRGASTTLPILKKSEFAKLTLRVAPKALQEEFALRIAVVNEQMHSFNVSLQRATDLFLSLQYRAFRGNSE
jgi:type I restriction enzyme S subunit